MDELIRLKDVAKRAGVSFSHFTTEAFITKDVLDKIKSENHIPSYIKKMLLAYVNKEKKLKETKQYEIEKKNLLNKARDLGLKIENDIVEVPLFAKNLTLEITEFQMRFIKFTTKSN